MSKKDDKIIPSPLNPLMKKIEEIENTHETPVIGLGFNNFLQKSSFGEVTHKISGEKHPFIKVDFWTNKGKKITGITLEDFGKNTPVVSIGMTIPYAKKFIEKITELIELAEKSKKTQKKQRKKKEERCPPDINGKRAKSGQKVTIFNGGFENQDIVAAVVKTDEGWGYFVKNLIGENVFTKIEKIKGKEESSVRYKIEEDEDGSKKIAE